MLTDLTFLDPGRIWPPASERERLKTYAANRGLFEAEHSEVFRETFKRIRRDLDSFGQPLKASYETLVNYPKLISVITAGMLFNRLPGIIAGKEGDAASMDAVQAIDDRSNLQEVLFSAALDASRYGDGLLYVRRDERGQGVIDITRPDCWFPVVDPVNVRRVLHHVLATPYELPEQQGNLTRYQRFLRVEIHSPGRMEVRNYRLDDQNLGQNSYRVLGQVVDAPKVYSTGIQGFAIIPVHNLRASDQVHGMDDYTDIQQLVSELEVRISQISHVLDRHTAPTMQGPAEALDRVYDEETKDYVEVFRPGAYFKNQVGGGQTGNVSYLTWDAQLEANFKQIELILNMIRVTSEMGTLLSDISDKTGAIPSGAAMRRMLYGTISKISRLRNSFAPAIKQALVAAAAISGVDLSGTPIYIDWPDVLPRDPLEQAQIADLRTGGKQTQSIKRAIMELDELDEDDAEDELDSIREEQSSAMPMLDSISSRQADARDEGSEDLGEGV